MALSPDALVTGGAWSFLALGFLIGIAHALDADHIAAIAALIEREDGTLRAMARGAAWGLGHTVALFAICSVALVLGLTIAPSVEAALEAAVGALIVGLGLRVLWRLHRDRVHIHLHDHDGARHVHAHSHAGEGAHRVSTHAHAHVRQLLPTMGVGLMHGAAGSAGLLVLVVTAAPTVGGALACFALFGLGSLLGMALLTAAAGWPLALVHRGGRVARTALALVVAGLAITVGGTVFTESLSALLG